MLATLVLVAVLAATAAILLYLPVPFFWVALLWSGVLFVLAIKLRHASLRVIAFNLAAVVMTLGALELYFHSSETERMAGSFTEDYFTDHEVLGYSPATGREFRAIKYSGEELVYDVKYRIDKRGLRVSPPAQDPPACGSVLFFGGSVTFGEGVEDDQAMPYVTGVMSDGRYAIDNFGFHGYGPHQMLAALEQGIVDATSIVPVNTVIYQGIPAHVARAAGRARWDRHGPRYVLQNSGKPVYAGPFDNGLPHPLIWLRKQLDKSAFYRWTGTLQQDAAPQEIVLYTAIVAAARDAVARKFPAAEFHVLLWGNPGEKTFDAILNGLRAAGVMVHPVSEILPGFTLDPATYEISPFDRHPNPRTHEQIARYVSSQILHSSACEASDLPVVSATQ